MGNAATTGRSRSWVLHRRTAVLCVATLLAAALAVATPQTSLARTQTSIVVDARTGKTILAHRADRKIYPASLTKMMTLYMLFDALKRGQLTMNSKLRVSRAATRVKPSKLYLKAGHFIRVRDAIPALVVKSANDVAVTVSEALGKSERNFARMMTRTARKLGMKHTVFRNASGLRNRSQRTTARDMAILARALLTRFPKDFHWFDRVEFSWKRKHYVTHNKLLLKHSRIDGMKTGYIRQSGFNVVVTMKHGRTRLIAVVIGRKTASKRDRDTVRLLKTAWKRLGVQSPFATRAVAKAAPQTPGPRLLPLFPCHRDARPISAGALPNDNPASWQQCGGPPPPRLLAVLPPQGPDRRC